MRNNYNPAIRKNIETGQTNRHGKSVLCINAHPWYSSTDYVKRMFLLQDVQFYLSVTGQALTGMGNPFAVALPTKVPVSSLRYQYPHQGTSILTKVSVSPPRYQYPH
jgi:hypothetical protein